MSYEFEPLNAIENPFYFGIGGIGDFLLLMSTFYDSIGDNTDVIFVCNNVKVIRRLSEMFPRVARFWFYPAKAFYPSRNMWNDIVLHDRNRGTGVTPNGFNYVEDWINCGNDGNRGPFEYYGVVEHPEWAKGYADATDYIVIHPFGGADDKTKHKEIPIDCLEDIICTWSGGIKIIGSEKENQMTSDNLKEIFTDSQINELNIDWVVDFKESFEAIRGARVVFAADTWTKTLAALAGKRTLVYPNVYAEGRKPMDLFNHPIDPSDYVFLNGWINLEIVDEDRSFEW